MLGDKHAKGDGDIRKDFPGGWKGDIKNAFEASGRTTKQNTYFNFTKKLFNWRKDNRAIHVGKTMQFLPENNVYVYFRYTDSEKVMVVINNNPTAQEVGLARFSEMIKGSTSGKEILFEKIINFSEKLKIAGKTSMIIVLK